MSRAKTLLKIIWWEDLFFQTSRQIIKLRKTTVGYCRPVDTIESLERTHTYVDKIDSRGEISSSGETVEFSIKLTQLAIHRKKVKLDLLFMLYTKIIIYR